MKRHRPLPSQSTTAGTPKPTTTITTFYTSKKPNLSTLKTSSQNPNNNWAPLNLNKSELNLPLTFPTGQTFRWKQTTPSQFTGVIGPHLISLKQIQDSSCQNDVVFYCIHNSHNKVAAKSALLDFLNMGICLQDLWVGFSGCDPRFAELAVCLSGARVLRQDPLECLIQFICSSNNNIKRITQMVDFVSSLGKFLGCVEGVEFYEFPSLDRLSEVSEDEFRKAGFGYRSTSIPPIKLDIFCKICVLSVLMYLSQVFGYIGLKYSSPTLSSIMGNLSPAFTFILAFLFRMEKVHLRSYTSQAKIIGTIVSISGAIIATVYSGPSVLSDSVSLDWILGGLLLALQYFLLAFSLVAQAKILQVYSVDLMVIFVFGLSGLFVAGIGGLVLARDMDAWKLEPNLVLVALLYMGFSSGFFNVVIQIWILRVKGPVYVAMFKPLTIVIALIMGVMYLGDTLYFGSVLGGSIITIGFYGVLWGKAKEAEDAPSNLTTAPLLEPCDVLERGSIISRPT